MNESSKEHMRKLLLGYEEQDAGTQQRLDAFLRENPELRSEFDRLRELESIAADPVPELPDLPLAPEDEAQEAASLLAVQRRTRAGTRPATRRRRGAPRRSGWLLAAAAAAILLFFAPWSENGTPGISELEVVLVGETGATRSAETRGGVRSGESIGIRFQLERAAHVVVYHLDPAGALSLLLPSAPETGPLPLAAGLHTLPDPALHSEWILGADTGIESFVVAAADDASRLDPARLTPLAEAAMAESGDREARLRSLESLISQHAESVQTIDLQHLP